MLPDSLSKYTHLRKVTMVLRAPPITRFYSCFASLLSNITSPHLTDIYFSLRPTTLNQRNTRLKTVTALPDIMPAFCTVDDFLVREQFENIHKGGVHIDLVTSSFDSEPYSILGDVFRSRERWEESVRQSMPHLDFTRRLQCVR